MKKLIAVLSILSACSSEQSKDSPTTSTSTLVEDLSTEESAAEESAAESPEVVVEAESTPAAKKTATPEAVTSPVDQPAFKLTADDCTDPDLSQVLVGTTFMLCDGSQGVGTYQAVTPPTPPDLSNLLAANIKSGVVINGVSGSYSGPSYDLSNLSAANIKSGVVINGTTGTYDNKPADCSANAQVGCVSTDDYKAADLSGLAPSAIRNGYTIAGVTGLYPSASYRMFGSDGTPDLNATFDAQVKSSATFEWFDSEGTRYTANGDTDIAEANIKTGVTVFGTTGTFAGTPVSPAAKDLRLGVVSGATTGSLKTVCRNTGNLALFDNPFPATNTVGSPNANNNTWDTLEDKANGTMPLTGINSGWSSDMRCAAESFRSLSTEGITNGSTWTGREDTVTGLWWAYGTGMTDWASSVNGCTALNVNSVTGWRLPTQKELMQFYVHGSYWMSVQGSTSNLYGFEVTPSYIAWSATSDSASLTTAWTMDLRTGRQVQMSKSAINFASSLCVR